jgi:TM2 domain-containing membrane protein YozV
MDPQQQPQTPTSPPVPSPGPTPVPTPQAPGPIPTPTKPAGTPAQQAPAGESDKDYLTAWLLSYFLGGLGADRFYMGETGLGILKLLTLGGCGIWALIDWIIIMAGARRDQLGRPLANREKNLKTSVIILVISIGLSLVLNLISFALTASSGL